MHSYDLIGDLGIIDTPIECARRYERLGLWGDATVLDWWNFAVLSSPSHIAVTDRSGASLTYREVDRKARHIASWLHDHEIGHRDIVAIQIPNTVQAFIVTLAVYYVGAVPNPLPMNLGYSEFRHAIRLCKSMVVFTTNTHRLGDYRYFFEHLEYECQHHALFVFSECAEIFDTEERKFRFEDVCNVTQSFAPVTDTRASDLAAILFTSGSESEPKGVMLTHRGIIASELGFINTLNIRYNDVFLMPAPIGHATGFMHGIIAPIVARCTAALSDSPHGHELVDFAHTCHATCGMSVPATIDEFISAWETRGIALEDMRFLCCGGAPVPSRLLQRARTLGIRIYSVYGSTESAPHTLTGYLDSDELVLSTDGCPCDGIDIAIVDPTTRTPLPAGAEGEEASRGPQLFVGYLARPELTRAAMDQDGWYYSGDLARAREDGYIRITGRIKDIINRGGENISTAEVEKALLSHPGITSACVVPVPDHRLGQRALAFIVLHPSIHSMSVAEILEYFQHSGIAKYKTPEYLQIVDKMPLTATGKNNKVLLRRRAEKLYRDGALTLTH